MKIKYATISKTGRRHNNEDAFNVIDMSDNNRFMGIVCDGMGGHSFGETASETVCNLSLIHISEPTRPISIVGSEMCIRDRHRG